MFNPPIALPIPCPPVLKVSSPAASDSASVAPAIRRRLWTRIARGPGVPEAWWRSETRRLQAFYRPYGIQFRPAGPEETVPLRVAAERPGPSSPADGLDPLRAMVRERGSPSEPETVRLVALERIAHPGSRAARDLGRLTGLGLAPRPWAGPGADGGADRLRRAGLPREFTPLVLVSWRDAVEEGSAATFTLAHELGHALGLPHRDEPANLMAPRPPACLPTLDPDQVRVLVGPAPGPAGLDTGR